MVRLHVPTTPLISIRLTMTASSRRPFAVHSCQ